MDRLRRLLHNFKDLFRSTGYTLGLSPKALAPVIGMAVTALLAAVGLTPTEVGSWVGAGPESTGIALTTVSAAVAAWLLGPGKVALHQPEISDNGGVDPALIQKNAPTSSSSRKPKA